MMTIGPIIVGVLLLLVAIIPRYRSKMLNLLIMVLYIVFPTVSQTLFLTFGCDSNFDEGVYLQADYQVDCEGAEHIWFMNYAALFILVYPVGVPLFYLTLLWRNKSKIVPNTKSMSKKDHHGAGARKSLAHGYSELKKLADKHSEVAEKALAHTEYRLALQIRAADKSIDHIRFLFEAYKVQSSPPCPEPAVLGQLS